jgi:hypothetical protein
MLSTAAQPCYGSPLLLAKPVAAAKVQQPNTTVSKATALRCVTVQLGETAWQSMRHISQPQSTEQQSKLVHCACS